MIAFYYNTMVRGLHNFRTHTRICSDPGLLIWLYRCVYYFFYLLNNIVYINSIENFISALRTLYIDMETTHVFTRKFASGQPCKVLYGLKAKQNTPYVFSRKEGGMYDAGRVIEEVGMIQFWYFEHVIPRESRGLRELNIFSRYLHNDHTRRV